MEQLRADRMKMEGSIPDWRVDQSIQKDSVFQCTTRVEAVTVLLSRVINNNKFQVFNLSIPQAGYSLIKMDVEELCHDVLLLSEEAAEEVVEQGITDFDDFVEMDDKDITGLCDKIRSTGGMIKKGDSGARANDLVPNRGIKIGFIAEKNLRQTRFYIYHMHRPLCQRM